MTRHRNAGFRHDLARFELEEPHAARNPSGRGVSRLNAVLRPLILALLALAVVPAAASAAVVRSRSTPRAAPTSARPTPSPASSPAPTARRSSGARWCSRSAATRSGGRSRRSRRRRPASTAASPSSASSTATTRCACSLPSSGIAARSRPSTSSRAPTLTFSLVRRNVIRIVQTYRTPTNVTLTAPTLFYVGRAGQADGPAGARADEADTRPVRREGQGRQGPLPRHARRSASPRPGTGASATRAASRTTRAWATRSWAARRSATRSRAAATRQVATAPSPASARSSSRRRARAGAARARRRGRARRR